MSVLKTRRQKWYPLDPSARPWKKHLDSWLRACLPRPAQKSNSGWTNVVWKSMANQRGSSRITTVP